MREMVLAEPGPIGAFKATSAPDQPSEPPKAPATLKSNMKVNGLGQDVIEAMAFLESSMIERQARYLKDPTADDAKFVIYHCDSSSPLCGGFGDRMNGLVTAFAFAVTTERALLISWSRYTPLTLFLEQNLLDWEATPEVLASLPDSQRTIACLDGCDTMLYEADVDYPERVLHIRTNVQIGGALLHNPHPNNAKYKVNLIDQRDGLFFRFMFHVLFKPSPPLEALFKPYLSMISSEVSVIGMHIRTGGDGGWYDPQFNTASMLDTYKLYAKLLHSSVPHLSARPMRLLLVTDSGKLLESARAVDGDIISSEGSGLPISHLDRTGANSFEGHARTFLDLLLLVHADGLVIPRSGFSEYSSAISCAPTIVVNALMNEGRAYRGDVTNMLTHGLCHMLPHRERGNIGGLPPDFYADMLVTAKQAKEASSQGEDLFLPGAFKYY